MVQPRKGLVVAGFHGFHQTVKWTLAVVPSVVSLNSRSRAGSQIHIRYVKTGDVVFGFELQFGYIFLRSAWHVSLAKGNLYSREKNQQIFWLIVVEGGFTF